MNIIHHFNKHNRYFIRTLFLVVLFILNSITCFARVYHIKQNGVPFEDQLFKIMSDIDKLPGSCVITVKIGSGYYNLNKTVKILGGKHKVIFEGKKYGETIISGSIEIKGWSVLSNGIWKAHVPFAVRQDNLPDQLYVNGRRATRARTPNTGMFILEGTNNEGGLLGAVLEENDYKLVGNIQDNDAPLLSIFRRWAVSKYYLSKYNSVKRTLSFKDMAFPSSNQLKRGNGLVIENTFESMDVRGEWCVDKEGTIYYFPKEDETIENSEFRMPIVERLFEIGTNSNDNTGVVFKNIIFEHTSFGIPPEGCNYDQAASPMSAAIEADEVNNIIFDKCEFRNISNYGIWFRQRCSNSSVINSYFHNLGAGAIKIGSLSRKTIDSTTVTKRITIENNIIFHYGELMESAVGIILFHASDCKITHNDIHYGEYTAISLGWMWGYGYSPSKRNEVAYNKISHIGSGMLYDLGGIYTLGESEGTYIHHNIISDVKVKNADGWGLYLDEGTTGIIAENNVIERCTSGFHQHYGSNNIICNNIFSWGEKSQITLSKVKEDYPLTFSHNFILFETGLLMNGDAVMNTKYCIKNNCYWKVSEGLPKIGNLDLITWLQHRDTTSVFKNESLRYSRKNVTRLLERSVCNAVGFHKFNCNNVGAYKNKKRTLIFN